MSKGQPRAGVVQAGQIRNKFPYATAIRVPGDISSRAAPSELLHSGNRKFWWKRRVGWISSAPSHGSPYDRKLLSGAAMFVHRALLRVFLALI